LYRQNAILNDFVNFLKARGRFRDIEFIENSVQATPRIPDLPSLVFYIEESRSEQQYILEIHGNESAVMNREIEEFFNLNQLSCKKIRIKQFITSDSKEPLLVEIEGSGEIFDTLSSDVNDLLADHELVVEKTQKTLFFSKITKNANQIPIRQMQVKRPQERSSTASTEETARIRVIKSQTVANHSITEESEEISKVESISKKPHTPNKKEILNHAEQELFEDSLETISRVDDEIPEKELFRDAPSQSSGSEDSQSDLFNPPPPSREYSDDIRPYLKQTSSLFRKDNWEEDLPTEREMEILERTYMRIKHRTKPEILAKDLGIEVEGAESYLRSLISKGLLRTQVGWYIIKKSHLPFFKNTFADDSKKKRKKKSPRISRVGEGLTPEEIATIRAIKSRPNLKAQSNLLTRPTGLKQSVLKEVLRNLVDKGILRVSYGWYILKDKHILEHKRGEIPPETTSETLSFKIPSELKLSEPEQRVIHALLQRPQFKAQSNLLTTDVKLPKDQIKQVLRDLVDKKICKVTYGWYTLKDPEIFQS